MQNLTNRSRDTNSVYTHYFKVKFKNFEDIK